MTATQPIKSDTNRGIVFMCNLWEQAERAAEGSQGESCFNVKREPYS